MTDPRTLRELALVQHIIRLAIQDIESRKRIRDLEQAVSSMWHAHVPLVGIADGARQSWPHVNPDGSDTIGGTK